MEETIKPDKKLFTKTVWVLLTISAFILAGVSVVHTIMYIADGDPNALLVIWLIAVIAILVMWLIAYPIAKLWIRNLAYLIQSERILKNRAIFYICSLVDSSSAGLSLCATIKSAGEVAYAPKLQRRSAEIACKFGMGLVI